MSIWSSYHYLKVDVKAVDICRYMPVSALEKNADKNDCFL